MRKNNRAAYVYLKQVSKSLPCGRRERKRIIRDIKRTVEEEYGDITYDDLVRRMGTPTEITEAYLSQTDAADVVKRVRYGDILIKIVMSAVIAALLIWGGYCISSYFSFKNELPIYLVEGEVEVVDRIEGEDDMHEEYTEK